MAQWLNESHMHDGMMRGASWCSGLRFDDRVVLGGVGVGIHRVVGRDY